jgi:hypothetical protein
VPWSSPISTRDGPRSSFGYLKQMRHWSLIRIEYCPLRFPFRVSRRLELSAARSPSEVAESRMRKRFSAWRRNGSHAGPFRPRQDVQYPCHGNSLSSSLIFHRRRVRSNVPPILTHGSVCGNDEGWNRKTPRKTGGTACPTMQRSATKGAAWKGGLQAGLPAPRKNILRALRRSHSSRRAAQGSSRAARRAGRKLAARATVNRTEAAPAIVSGSCASTP